MPPTDLLTSAIQRAVREAIREELANLNLNAPAPAPKEDELLTTADVAQRTNISEVTLRRWRSEENPDGPRYVRAGRLIRYRESDIAEWLERSAA